MQEAYEVDFGGNGNFGDITWGLPETEEGDNIRIVKVKVVCGLNLAKKDIFGLSDPYCRIQLHRSNDRRSPIAALQTCVRKKTLNPRWDTECAFRVDTINHYLLFRIFDENRLTRDDFLGEACVQLQGLYTEGDPGADVNCRMVYDLSGRSHKSRVRGTITIEILLQDTNTPTSAPPTPASGISEWNDDAFVALQLARELSRTSESQDSFEVPADVEQHEDSETVSIPRDHPRPHRFTQTTEIQQDPLPDDIEERQDNNGRTFYVNHTTRTTSWVRPVVTAPSSTPAESPGSPEMSREFIMRRHISQEDGVVDQSPPPVLPIIDETDDDVLPPGWEARQVPNGRILYIDHNTRATTWDRPTAVSTRQRTAVPEEASAPAATAAAASTTTEPVPREEAQPEESGATAAPSAPVISGPPSNERLHPDVPSISESALPPGWAMQLAPNGRVFFIDHNTRKTAWIDPRTNQANTADAGLGPLPSEWDQRCHSDGRVFFIDHATQSTQWEDPRIQLKAKQNAEALPYSRDYKRKYEYFRSKLKPPENVASKYEIHVRRNNLFEDSYRFVLTSCKNVELLKTKLWIVFDGETGLDYGGVSREWFYLLSKEIFNPYYGLFEYSATDNYTLQINPNSNIIQPEHLSYFKFIGRVAGMAVYHGKLLDAFFIRPFYKMLLQKKITLQDLESVDSEYHNSLKWLLENDPEVLDLTFVIEEEVFGTVVSRELCENGNSLPVTQANKHQYIDLVIKWRFIDRIQSQMKSFAQGFHDIIPMTGLAMFDERELEYLLCGLGEINVTDWRANTQYRSGYHDKHVVIQWFWKAVSTFDNEIKARLLQFVTGTSRVPMNGFAELYGSNGPQKFAIERWGNANQLPRSHTCFNRLDLPPYLSYHELREKLRLAIENTEGFEGVD